MKRACRPSSTAPLKITRSSRAEAGIPRAGFSDFRPFSTAIRLSAPPGASASERRRARSMAASISCATISRSPAARTSRAARRKSRSRRPSINSRLRRSSPYLMSSPRSMGAVPSLMKMNFLTRTFSLSKKKWKSVSVAESSGWAAVPMRPTPSSSSSARPMSGARPEMASIACFMCSRLITARYKGSRVQGVQGSREEARPGAFFSLEPSTPWTLDPSCCGSMPLPQ